MYEPHSVPTFQHSIASERCFSFFFLERISYVYQVRRGTSRSLPHIAAGRGPKNGAGQYVSDIFGRKESVLLGKIKSTSITCLVEIRLPWGLWKKGKKVLSNRNQR